MVGRWNFRLKWSLFTGHVHFRGGRRFCNIYSLTARCEAFRNTAKLWQIWTKSDGLNSHAGDHAGTKPCAYLSNLSACLYQHADLQEMPNSGPRSSLVPTLCHPWRPCFLLHPQIHIRADPRSPVTSDKVQKICSGVTRHPCCNGHPRNSCDPRDAGHGHVDNPTSNWHFWTTRYPNWEIYSTFVKKHLRILALGHPDCCDWEPPNSKLFHTTRLRAYH